MSAQVKVENVSDTALWVAVYRAQETLRPDAVFKDPLAKNLVGERGHAIAKLLGNVDIMYWIMVIRTLAIDRLVKRAIELGVDCVVNLGAGLDTRPYRMVLPENLRWIEIDFPHIIEFKNAKLAAEKPVCRLERIPVDLSNLELRRESFRKISESSQKVLIITEGVIPYLSNAAAGSLAKDLHQVPNFLYWIQDYRRAGMKQSMPRRFRTRLKAAAFIFDVSDWFVFFKDFGWEELEGISALDESTKIGRPFPMPFPWNIAIKFMTPGMKKGAMERLRKDIGYTLLSKTRPSS